MRRRNFGFLLPIRNSAGPNVSFLVFKQEKHTQNSKAFIRLIMIVVEKRKISEKFKNPFFLKKKESSFQYSR